MAVWVAHEGQAAPGGSFHSVVWLLWSTCLSHPQVRVEISIYTHVYGCVSVSGQRSHLPTAGGSVTHNEHWRCRFLYLLRFHHPHLCTHPLASPLHTPSSPLFPNGVRTSHMPAPPGQRHDSRLPNDGLPCSLCPMPPTFYSCSPSKGVRGPQTKPRALTQTRVSLGLGRLGSWVAQKTKASLAVRQRVSPAALGKLVEGGQEEVGKPR